MNKLMQCFKRLFIIYDYKAVEMVYVGSKFCHTDLTLLCVYVCVWKGENGSLWIKCSDEDKQERISNSNMKPSFVCELKINVFLSQNLLGTIM